MRLLHLGDLHLGRTLGDFDLKEDQQYILQEILAIIKEKEIDAVLIAGDVYDKAVPSETATNLLNGFLTALAECGKDTFIISGNHDSDDRLNYGSSLFALSHIYIAAKYEGTLVKHTLSDEYGEMNIYLLPFIKASEVRHYFPDEDIRNYEDAVRTVLAHAEIDESKRNVIAAHQFVAGISGDLVLGGSEGIGTKSVGLVEKIGSDSFDVFDYAALGHIHSPQQVGRPEVRYSGSPLKYSLSEADDAKSVPVITLGEKGSVSVELVPLTPLRDMRHIRGKMAQLLDRGNVTSPEDFIYATLTDEDIIDNSMAIFQQVYPNTIRIDYDNSHTRAAEQIDFTNIVGDRSFAELIGDFYRLMYGCEISKEELDYMEMAAREAGVLHETD